MAVPHPPPGSRPLGRRTFLARAAQGAFGLAAGMPLLSACGSDGPATAAAQGSGDRRSELTIRTCVYAKNHASSPLYWQQFAPESVTVDVSVISSAAEVQHGLEAGHLDFGLMGLYNTILAQDQQGINSKIISMCSREGAGLVVRADRGIDTVEDLRGKRVGVPSPGVQVLILNTLLGRAGMTLGEDLQGVPLGYADHPTALARGDIDAYIGTEPLCTQSVVDGVGQRLEEVYETPVGDFNTAMWASPAVLEQPDIVRMALEMQRRAAEHLTPDGVNDHEVWKDLLVTQFGYDPAVYEEVISNVGAVWRFDDERRRQFEGAGAILLEQGVISQEPDYDAFYASDYWDA